MSTCKLTRPFRALFVPTSGLVQEIELKQCTLLVDIARLLFGDESKVEQIVEQFLPEAGDKKLRLYRPLLKSAELSALEVNELMHFTFPEMKLHGNVVIVHEDQQYHDLTLEDWQQLSNTHSFESTMQQVYATLISHRSGVNLTSPESTPRVKSESNLHADHGRLALPKRSQSMRLVHAEDSHEAVATTPAAATHTTSLSHAHDGPYHHSHHHGEHSARHDHDEKHSGPIAPQVHAAAL